MAKKSSKSKKSSKPKKPDTSHRGMRQEHPANDEAAERERAIAAGKPWRGQRDKVEGSSDDG